MPWPIDKVSIEVFSTGRWEIIFAEIGTPFRKSSHRQRKHGGLFGCVFFVPIEEILSHAISLFQLIFIS